MRAPVSQILKFKNEDSIMILGGILGAGGKKQVAVWERNDWRTISAQTYVDHILYPIIWPFWYWESMAQPGHPSL